ncbi:MAG TPA: NfeD family protein [Rubricoccaceae bacterium]|nr:NfeD family protein [Rubricoccaceae bacterium]
MPVRSLFLLLVAALGLAEAHAKPPQSDSTEAASAAVGATAARPTPIRRGVAFPTPLGPGPVYRVPLQGMVDNALARYVARAVADAEADGATLIVFEEDTFGGLIDAADAIRQTILNTNVPTLAFVDRNAASAGALIAYACDRIVMVPGASIGAATAVDATGEYASEKVQSYMRSLMRATAEANGRDPHIAEAMVDERIEIPGVDAPNTLLSLSADEALRLGVADAVHPSVGAVLAELGVSGRAQVAHRASPAERVLRFLGSPVVASLLLLMMMGGLYFEMHAPGFGFAGLMALIGAALFFAPHYLLGLAESWELIVVGVGIALILLEVLLLPGFGVPGVVGIILATVGILAALVGNVGLDFPGPGALLRAMTTLATAVVLFALIAVALAKYLPEYARFNPLVLTPSLRADEGYTAAATDAALVGVRGTAVTPLRPAGTADLAGRRVDVVAQGTFVPAGTAIEVVSVRGSRVEVRPA